VPKGSQQHGNYISMKLSDRVAILKQGNMKHCLQINYVTGSFGGRKSVKLLPVFPDDAISELRFRIHP
jgi:hypothetical protein